MYKCIGCIVLFSVAISSPILVIHETQSYQVGEESRAFCGVRLENYTVFSQILDATFVALTYCIPVLLLTIVHTTLLVTLRQRVELNSFGTIDQAQQEE